MPVLSYVVFPAPGRTAALADTLSALDGCEVAVAENREMLLLVTSAESPAEDRALRARVESEEDIEALVLAFGEIDPETEEADPVAAAREADPVAAARGAEREVGGRGLRLPVLEELVSSREGRSRRRGDRPDRAGRDRTGDGSGVAGGGSSVPGEEA